MRGKIFALILIIVFLIASGCAGKESATNDTNKSAPKASMTEQKEGNVLIPGEMHQVILRAPPNHVFVPTTLDIKTGDTIAWISQNPQKPDYVLVSKENLFSETALDYRVSFNYTLVNPGTYFFYVKDFPDMNITVTVK